MSSYTEQELAKSYSKAKVMLMNTKNSVFISSVLFSLGFKWDRDDPKATGWTDGTTIGINPDYWMNLPAPVRVSLLCHETWHVAFNHMFRGKKYNDHERFNIAADHVINLMLKAAGFTIPDTWYCDNKYSGMSTEQVYKLLPPSKPNSGYKGDIRNPGKGEADQAQNKVKEILQRASARSKMSKDVAGTVPGDVAIMLDKLVNPRLPWTTILQNYMSSFSKNDYTFKKPNRRFFPEYYLPSLYSEALGEICVAVDTSCSVSDDEFRIFLSEIRDIKEKLQPEQLTVIDFDTSIHTVHVLGQGQGVESISFHGRGGTDLTPVFEHYGKDKKPVVLIVFSDLECTEIQEDPGYPVVWVCINNLSAHVNFGELIHMDTRE